MKACEQLGREAEFHQVMHLPACQTMGQERSWAMNKMRMLNLGKAVGPSHTA